MRHNCADHSHGHHAHPGADSEKRLLFMAALTGSYMVVQAVGGYLSNSLALLADVVHMFSDTAVILLAWAAMRLARRAPDAQRTYGYQRFQILAAYTNALILFAVIGWILWEAVERI